MLPQALNPHLRLNDADKVCILALFALALGTIFTAINTAALWVLTPLAFLLCMRSYSNRMKNLYLLYLFLLYAWQSCLLFETQHFDGAVSLLIRCWGTFMICYITYCMGWKRKTFIITSIVYFVALIAVIYYVQTHLAELIMQASEGRRVRVNGEGFNANSAGYYLVIITCITYIFGNMRQLKWQKWFRYLLIFLIPFTFYISVLTASRQILILSIPFIFIYLWKRYFKFKPKEFLISVGVLLIFTAAYVNWGERFYKQSFLYERMSEKLSEDSRAQLIRESINIFLENPVTGIGPDEFRHRSQEGAGAHNSFLELLADSGIIGCTFYVAIFWVFLYRQYSRWRLARSNFFFGAFIYGLVFLIENFFYIFYTSPLFISFFFLMAGRSDAAWSVLTRKMSPETVEYAEDESLLPNAES